MKVREQRDELVRRLPLLRIGFTVAAILIASAYWLVQVVHGSYYRELADNNRLRKVPIKAPRGLIFDRHERLLVDNVPSYQLFMDRSRSADIDSSLRHAAGILDRPVETLVAELERYRGSSQFTPVLLAESLSLSEVARFSVEALEHPEFEIEVGHLRVYRHGPMAAHLLGYLGEASEKDLERWAGELRVGDLVGRSGAEHAFDESLRGEDGERVVVVDSRGRLLEEHGNEEARPGRPLRLTLDLDLQQEAARYFADRVGAAVALDPRNGEILALVSAPSFDPNLFARRLRRSEWAGILESAHHPLQNRALQSEYSPGSIFKIVLAIGGLNDKAITPQEKVFCGGSTRIYDRRFRCWKRRGHGTVDLHSAIRESCDVYFYHLGQKLGITRIAHYARMFGFGLPTRLEITGEKAGLVPDLEWSQRARGGPWYPGETISVAIGQGPLLVTPLQIASMMATVANGGRVVTPRLEVAEDDTSGGDTEQAFLAIDPEAMTIVRDALWAVVNERGTGAAARLNGIDIAGKTGTAQVVEQKTWVNNEDLPFEKRDHAWFAAFGGFERPELVVVVFVEHGGKGSEEAAPLAKQLYEKYFESDRASNRKS